MGAGTIALIGLGLGAATAGVGAYSSAQEASAANRYGRQQQEYGLQVQAAQTKAARLQAQQIAAQGELEQQKTAREAQQIRSTLRVAAGESGLGLGGTFDALMRQASSDEAMNMSIIERNSMMAQQSAMSQISPLPPQQPVQNATLAAVLGGLGGAQSGLSLATSGMNIYKGTREPVRTGGTA